MPLPILLTKILLIAIGVMYHGDSLSVHSKHKRLTGFFYLLQEFRSISFEDTKALYVS